jgi:hypothetical protein
MAKSTVYRAAADPPAPPETGGAYLAAAGLGYA